MLEKEMALRWGKAEEQKDDVGPLRVRVLEDRETNCTDSRRG